MARTFSSEQTIMNLGQWLNDVADGNYEVEIPGPTRLLISKQGKNLSAPFVTDAGRAQSCKVRPVEPQTSTGRTART